MFCQHCGKESEETNRFCPYCGQPVQQSSIPNQKAPSQQPYSVSGQQNQQQYGTGGYSPQSSYTYNTTPSAPFSQQLPMKWYNFVIWFQLFVSALFSLYNAVRYFTGAHYGEGSAELVYFFYGNGLKVLDIVMGICSVICIGWAIYARQQLRHYKRQAPMIYIVYLGFNVVTTIVYLVCISVITQEFLLDVRSMANLAGNIVMIVLNVVYFQKRSSLFVG